MNTHAVPRHVKPQPCANTSQTWLPSPPLALPQIFCHRSLFTCFPKPPALAGGASGSLTLKASPKGEGLPDPPRDETIRKKN